MGEESVDDPAFGKLVWDGSPHGGWIGSFAGAAYRSWGAAIRPADGAGDADWFQRVGRFKVVVRDRERPTAAQQAAWRGFLAGGESLAERIASALLDTYQRQRPERLRWWALVYGDSPDRALPDVTTTGELRAIMLPTQFQVDGQATVAVVLESFWSWRPVRVRVRDGQVVDVGPNNNPQRFAAHQHSLADIQSPAFGTLRWGGSAGVGWKGVFRSNALRGWDDAAEVRRRFRERPKDHASPYRRGPSWDTVAGEFPLHVFCGEDDRPTAEQEAAYQRFNADAMATAQLVLAAIVNWYDRREPEWITEQRGLSDGDPSVRADRQVAVLEIIELESVTVLTAPAESETVGPRLMKIQFGKRKGETIALPPKNPGVAIVLSFQRAGDEHGLGVRWRNGQVESVGTWESVFDDWAPPV